MIDRLLISYLIVLQRQRLAVISAVEGLTACVEAVVTVTLTVKPGRPVVISSCHGIAPNVAVLRGFSVSRQRLPYRHLPHPYRRHLRYVFLNPHHHWQRNHR